MRIASIAIVALALAGAAGAVVNPSVRFTSLLPVTVHGAQFAPSERVRVTVSAGSIRRSRTAWASRRGVFSVGFGTIAREDRCSGSLSIVAVGARGSRALYKLPQMACPVPASNSATG